MTESIDYFKLGLELYQKKHPLKEVIDTFYKALEVKPKDASIYTCLSWLYILKNETFNDLEKAIEYAKLSIKLDPNNIQGYFNLILASLMTNRKGIRDLFNKTISKASKEDIDHAILNLKEALERKPDFREASKLLNWLEG